MGDLVNIRYIKSAPRGLYSFDSCCYMCLFSIKHIISIILYNTPTDFFFLEDWAVLRNHYWCWPLKPSEISDYL